MNSDTAEMIRRRPKEWALDFIRSLKDRYEPGVHDLRFAQSFEFLMQQVFESKVAELGGQPLRILDAGGRSTFGTVLVRAFTELGWPLLYNTTSDFTKSDGTTPDIRTFKITEKFHVVLFMEVIEHLHDLNVDGTMWVDEDKRARWTGDGQFSTCMALCHCLEPLGVMFTTTPNPCGLRGLYNILQGASPITYEPHVREITLDTVLDKMKKCGMRIVYSGSWTVWGHHGLSPNSIDLCQRILAQAGVPGVHRGDDLYCLSQLV